MKTLLVLIATGIILGAQVLAVSTASAQFRRQPGVIYGNDDRKEIFQISDPQLLASADATVAVVKKTDLVAGAPVGSFRQLVGQAVTLKAPQYGPKYGLCKNEPFYSQPTGAFCSGFLIAPNLVATAGHCVEQSSCGSTAFIFGFQMNSNNSAQMSFPATEVYGCAKVIARELTNKQDYAVIQLDRPVQNHKPLPLARRAPAANEPLYVIGHPAGLPRKLADGANVRRLAQGFFVTNLDTYGGNSGSAVFSAATNEVLGILVRGENDFNMVNGCRLSNECKSDGCRGEDVTFIDYVIRGATAGLKLRPRF